MTPTDAAREILRLAEVADKSRNTDGEAAAYFAYVVFAKMQMNHIARALVAAETLIRDIADNYEHDAFLSGCHTRCRRCDAEKYLEQYATTKGGE